MREQDGKYVCVLCGAVLDVRPDAVPKTMFKQASGGPRIRVLIVDGREIHECEVKGPAARRS